LFHILGACPQGLDVGARIGPEGGDSGARQPAEPDADDLPPALGRRARRDDLGTVGQWRDPLSPRRSPNQVQHPVTDRAGVLIPFLTREAAHPLAQGSDDPA